MSKKPHSMLAHVYRFTCEGVQLTATQIEEELEIQPSFGNRKVIIDHPTHGACASLYLAPEEMEWILPPNIEFELITKAKHEVIE